MLNTVNLFLRDYLNTPLSDIEKLVALANKWVINLLKELDCYVVDIGGNDNNNNLADVKEELLSIQVKKVKEWILLYLDEIISLSNVDREKLKAKIIDYNPYLDNYSYEELSDNSDFWTVNSEYLDEVENDIREWILDLIKKFKC